MVDWDKMTPPIVGNRIIGTDKENPKTLAIAGEKPINRSVTNSVSPVREKYKSVVEKKKRKSKPRQTVDVSRHLDYLKNLISETGIGSLSGVVNMIIYQHKQTNKNNLSKSENS